MIQQLYLEDFEVDAEFDSAPRTVTDSHFTLFAALSGDDHPIHYDDHFAAGQRFGKRVAHGLLLTGMTALGGSHISARLQESVVAFVEQRTRYLKPVFIGDTFHPRFRVAEVTPKSDGVGLLRLEVSAVNQEGTQLLEGEQIYLIRSRAAADG